MLTSSLSFASPHRAQLHELEILSSQRCAALDAELVSARAAADAGAAEAHAARLALVRQEGVAKGGQERAALLEKQLARAQERMRSVRGMWRICVACGGYVWHVEDMCAARPVCDACPFYILVPMS
jgi:hypothetical protein